MESSGRGRKAFLTAAGVLVALGLVAIAARGSTPVGDGGARRPTDTLLDILLSLYVVMLAAGAVLFLYLLAIGRHSTSRAPGHGRDWRNWGGVILLVGVLILIANGLPERRLGADITVSEAGGGGAQTQTTSETAYQAEFAWIPVGITLSLLVLGGAAWLWSGRTRRRARGERWFSPLAEDLAAALDLSLDDLRAEPDPRRAVIAAYARLEDVLAAHRLPRRAAEAPLEYLARMLAELEVSDRAARRLTGLFERAKFSQHAVGQEMKDDAIAALERVRDDLLAAQALAEQARAQALAARTSG